mmetsp:Transcript_31266/g.61736  ORF Transcript_31266/g.61736 Transcript_31266/m.61736 type:complete len:204 (+) Transcript_31266:118-729(+)
MSPPGGNLVSLARLEGRREEILQSPVGPIGDVPTGYVSRPTGLRTGSAPQPESPPFPDSPVPLTPRGVHTHVCGRGKPERTAVVGPTRQSSRHALMTGIAVSLSHTAGTVKRSADFAHIRVPSWHRTVAQPPHLAVEGRTAEVPHVVCPYALAVHDGGGARDVCRVVQLRAATEVRVGAPQLPHRIEHLSGIVPVRAPSPWVH